jgi:class 3 adenylate cyclase
MVVKRLIDMDGVAIVSASDSGDVFTLDPIEPSHSAVEEVCESRRVRWSSINQGTDTNESQIGLEYFIGAPIVVPRESTDEVQAVLYAHRSLINSSFPQVRRQPLTALHAQVFELIACSVAAGLYRIENQATQGRFQQFFTPALAKELMKSDAVLTPCQREVTVLFSDIRRFSSISEKLGPMETSHWVQDVMTNLSDCVISHDGVLVDYIGDELMAMWGAPADQPDHATRACNCALDIMKVMPAVNEKWRDKIGSDTQVGIGINTGMANVGNTGSKYKFKYGPLGDMVNRASRVQGLTKYLRVKAIMTRETQSQLEDQFLTRRLGKAKVVNIDKSIELFELCSGQRSDEPDFVSRYEDALKDLELGHLESAAGILKNSLDFDRPDHPALLIMNEIIQRVINDERSGDFEWEFTNK